MSRGRLSGECDADGEGAVTNVLEAAPPSGPLGALATPVFEREPRGTPARLIGGASMPQVGEVRTKLGETDARRAAATVVVAD